MYTYRQIDAPDSASCLARFGKAAQQAASLPASDTAAAALVHSPRTDMQIAHDCERALQDLAPAPDYAIVVMVSNGWVKLSGHVAEGFERSIAETQISSLPGVQGVSSQVKVRPSRAGHGSNASRNRDNALKSGSYEFMRSYDGMTWSEMRDSWAARRALLHAAWSASGTGRVAGGIRPS